MLTQVPIAVRDPSTGAWRLVSWIDSKATFGDDTTHSRQMEEQYSTYLHRYGPGLVIYWFGCLDDLAVQVGAEAVLRLVFVVSRAQARHWAHGCKDQEARMCLFSVTHDWSDRL